MSTIVSDHFGQFGTCRFSIPDPNTNGIGFVGVSFCEIPDCGYDNLSHTSHPIYNKKHIKQIPEKRFVDSILQSVKKRISGKILNLIDVRDILLFKVRNIKKKHPREDPHYVWHGLLDHALKIIISS